MMLAMLLSAALVVTINDIQQSDLLQTKPIQAAIDRVSAAGGGEVVIPEGRYRTGGLVLKSGVTLRLADGATLEADRNPDNYPGENRWYRALIRADGAHDIGIVGGRYSCLDGMNCYDPRGEENYRGPHAIMFIGCTNITLRGYAIWNSANWAHALFHCAKAKIAEVRVYGGHDAVDFHDSSDIVVENCELRTGDDCIAGFANRHCLVRNCILDTSCQAVRIGGNDIRIERCHQVPSTFGHRAAIPLDLRRKSVNAGEYAWRGMNCAVIYYCDTRWQIDIPQRDIVFSDCVFECPRQIFSLTYDGRDMWCCRHPLESIAFERCMFDNIERPIYIYGDEQRPLDFTMRDCTVKASPKGADKPLLTAYNFGTICLSNVTLKGFNQPHLITRSQGKVAVSGGTPIEQRFRPDPNDKVYTFAECAAELKKFKADKDGWQAWCRAHPTPPESCWSAEKGLYVFATNSLAVDVWGSALAVLRGETKHRDAISRRLCGSYQYFAGWWRKSGIVSSTLDISGKAETSPIPAGAFGYAMSFFDPLFARTFFTDFIRNHGNDPVAVAGMMEALSKLNAAFAFGGKL